MELITCVIHVWREVISDVVFIITEQMEEAFDFLVI